MLKAIFNLPKILGENRALKEVNREQAEMLETYRTSHEQDIEFVAVIVASMDACMRSGGSWEDTFNYHVDKLPDIYAEPIEEARAKMKAKYEAEGRPFTDEQPVVDFPLTFENKDANVDPV